MKLLSLIVALAAAAMLMSGASPARAGTSRLQNEAAWRTRCQALAGESFSDVIDAPSHLTVVKPVEANGDTPAYCEVDGYALPQVGFQVLLPASGWNGKVLELGCGGECGDATGYVAACSGPLHKGYACMGSDTGHTGTGGLWAYNNLQAQVDYGYRAPHVTVVAGKAIVERYYHEAPKRAYFMGGSTGGRQALVAAQRFPWDFDGIISGAPWIDDTASTMNYVWAYRALRGKDGAPIVNRADLKLVHEAVLAKCDLNDGVKDGVIGDPASCDFDARQLVCAAGNKTRCLTEAQARAINKVYAGPTNSKGEKIYVGGAVPGSEMGWVDDGMLDYIRSNQVPSASESWALAYFRYMVMPAAGPGWTLMDFDFDKDYKRFGGGAQESLLTAANPDLRKFKAAGGKLLIFQGWNDQSDLPAMTIDYYKTVERTMGGREATADFCRLFVVPGMLHVTGGEGAFAIDYLSYLEKWVEEQQPPDQLLGAHVAEAYLEEQGRRAAGGGVDTVKYDGAAAYLGANALRFPLDPAVPITFTRPVFPYPVQARYRGTGDLNSATSFVPVDPAAAADVRQADSLDRPAHAPVAAGWSFN